MVVSTLATVVFTVTAFSFVFHESTWYDEACSMTSARGSLGDTLAHALNMENQPPLYFLLLNLWLRLHRSIGFARVISLCAAVLGVLLTVRTLARVSRDPPPALVPISLIVLFANPFTMYVATEARGYALQFALGAMLASIMTSILLRGFGTIADVAKIIAIGTALGYINYLAGLAAGAVVVSLFLARRISLGQAAAVGVGGAILTLPILSWARRHFQDHADVQQGHSLAGAGAVFRELSNVVVPQVFGRGPWQAIAVTVLCLAAASGFFFGFGRKQGLPLPWSVPKPYLVASGVAVALFVVVGLTGGAAVVQQRYFAAFLPIIWITTLLTLRASLGWTWVSAVLLLLSLGGAYRIERLHGSGIRMGDWRRVAERIGEGPPVLPVYVYPPVEALSLRVELGDVGRVEAFPHPFDGSVKATVDDYLAAPEDLRSRVSARVGTGPFWLAFTTVPIVPVQIQKPLALVKDFLAQDCVIDREFDFIGSRLLLVRLAKR